MIPSRTFSAVGRKFEIVNPNEEDDQNLGLIDISHEDDDLLSNSASLADFRLSVGFDDVDKNHQGSNLLSSSFQSFGRPSLAWDSAFFTNEGVLDEDELSSLNKGFQTAKMQLEDVNTIRFKLGLSTRNDVVSSGSKKVNMSTPNWKNKSAFGRGDMNTQRALKNNKTQMKSASKREDSHFSASRAPKASSSPMTNLLPGKNRSASTDAKKENRPYNTRSVENLKLRKNSGTENKCRLSYASPSPAAESPYMMKNLQMSSPFSCQPKEQESSPSQPGFYSTPDTAHAFTESRREPKPSNLRAPSPKIGFFDEKRSDGHTRLKVWSSVSRSVSDLKSPSGEIGEWVCAKCRKTGPGILDRKRVSRISASRQDDDEVIGKGRIKSRLRRDTVRPNDDPVTPREVTNPGKNAESKAKNLQDQDDRVNDLSKYFELMDLTKEKANDQKTLLNHSPRTPLSELSRISGSMKQTSSKEKVPEKPLIPTFADKENISPYGA